MKNIQKSVIIEEIRELHKKATEAERKAEYPLCEKYCNEIALRLNGVDRNDEEYAPLLANNAYLLGIVTLKQGDFARARELHFEALDIAEKIADGPLTGRILRAIASLYADTGFTKESLEYAHRALAKLEEVGLEREIGHTYNTIARIFYGIADFEQAIEYSGKALSIFKQKGLEEEYARLSGNLGVIDFARGDYAEALRKMLESLAYFESKNMPYDMARLYDSIAGVYEMQSRLVEAIEFLEKSIAIRQNIGDVTGLAKSMGNMGIVYYAMSEYSKSLEYHTRSLEMCKSLSLQHDIIRELGNIGNVYYSLNEYDRALEIYIEALNETKKTNNQREVARLYSNIGQTYKSLNNLDLALKFTLESLEIDRALDTKSTIARSCSILGVLYHILDDYEEALKYMYEALALYEKIGMLRGVADICADISDLLLDPKYSKHNAAEAERFLQKSIQINTELSLNHALSRNMLQMAEMCKMQERWEESANSFQKHIDLYKQVQSDDTRKSAEKFSQGRDIALMNREKELLYSKNSELEEANSFKTKLMAMAAHDLKNPTSNIKLIAAMLTEMIEHNTEVYDLVRMIQDSAEHMNNMITSLLESAAAQTGTIQLEKKRTNVRSLVKKSADFFSLSAGKKKQVILADLSECYAMLDEERFMQVVDNIIGNAVKYSYENSFIKVSLKNMGSTLLFTVADQGQGLTQEDIQQLFQQFKRLSSVPTGSEHSSGLGLHIVKQIVGLHGGEIWAESDGKDQGTTFFVEIPTA